MKFRQQVAVGGAIVNSDGKLLFVRRVADDEFMPGVWELPGGGTEYGEKYKKSVG
jgi:8-oxo-dGTP pyrophosphatase MutT (NUDIX family)